MDAMTDLNLKLGLPGTDSSGTQPAVKSNKRTLADAVDDGRSNSEVADAAGKSDRDRETAPTAKAQVVGWPPIRSYRKNTIQARKTEADAAGIYVKVSMDGAPYLRKIDLKVYNGYPELLKALGDMFKCFSIGNFSERQEYVPTYEDKDGDWMLVGDVPWEMFISSCKRLRIMKGSEARGLGSCA